MVYAYRQIAHDIHSTVTKYADLHGSKNAHQRAKQFTRLKVLVRLLLVALTDAGEFKPERRADGVVHSMAFECAVMHTMDHEGSRLDEFKDYPHVARYFFGTDSESPEVLLNIYGREWLMAELHRNYAYFLPHLRVDCL